MLALLLAAACREPPRAPVAIDLTRAGYGELNGRMGPLPLAFRNRRQLLVQTTPGTIDIAVVLPAQAVLRLKFDEDVPRDAFAVSLELDGRWHPLEMDALPGGHFSAVLPQAEGQHARVRLENRRATPIEWSAVMVGGQAQELPPTLGAEVRPPAGVRPTVIVYLVDALRADHLSVYGYGRDTTPRLAALARHGVVFENAYSMGPSTANTIPSIFTSRYPSELGGNFKRAPGPFQTLAEAFRNAGYAATGAFTVNPLLQPSFGYARGFATYRLLELPPGSEDKCCPRTPAIHAAVQEWVKSIGNLPFFLYVHTLDVHDYAPGPNFLGRFTGDGLRTEPALPVRARPPGAMSLGELFRRNPKNSVLITPDRYDEAIASVDDELGRFVDALPDREHTIIVFTADHGEALGNEDDGSYMHGQSLHEELVRVPLVMVVPWLDRTVRVQDVVSHLDLAPTLADLVEAPGPWWRGRSWFRPTRATSPPSAVFERLSSFAQPEGILGPGLYRVASWGIRQDAWKLILEPEGPRLFDLRADPKETRDVHAVHPWLVSRLVNEIWTRSPALREAGMPTPAPVEEVPAAERQRLRQALEALGYVE